MELNILIQDGKIKSGLLWMGRLSSGAEHASDRWGLACKW